MKALFVVKSPPGSIHRLQASAPYLLMSHFPGEVIEVTSPSEALGKIDGAAVILFVTLGKEGRQFVFGRGWEFINELAIFVGVFNTDPWIGLRNWNSFLRKDVVVSTFFEAYLEREGTAEGMFWSPSCVDVQNYNLPRSIDILTFGRIKRRPFRRFIMEQLQSWSIGEPKCVNFHSIPQLQTWCAREPRQVGFYSMQDINIDGNAYTWGNLPLYACSYPDFYQLVSSAKLCIADSQVSPTRVGIPFGRHFEISACGTVAVSSKFSDSDALGFKHGETIWFTNRDSFKDDLVYLLKNPTVVERISNGARELIRDRHTPEIRARALYEFLHQRTGKV
jgi:hypothetical protein